MVEAVGGPVLAGGTLVALECLDVRGVFDLLAAVERARVGGEHGAGVEDAHGVEGGRACGGVARAEGRRSDARGRREALCRAYGLTVDRREAAALEQILRKCVSTAMEPKVCRSRPSSSSGTGRNARGGGDVLARYDDNRNGRITCKEARRHGIAPVHRSHPAYRYMRDGDGDGVVCE